MALWPTGNVGFDAAVTAAENVYQSAVPNIPAQALADQATIAYLRTVIQAGIDNNVSTINQQDALRALLSQPTSLVLSVLPQTLEVIQASPIPVSVDAALLINNAIMTWISLGVTGAQLEVRVGELQTMIRGGWVMWSQYGVNPSNRDNGPALSSLPSGVLILADTVGNLPIQTIWELKSNLFVVSAFNNVLVSTMPSQIQQGPLAAFLFGLIGQTALGHPGISPGAFPFLNNIYLFGINVQCTDVNASYSVFTWNANNFQLLYFTAAQYASLIFCVGANNEIAYGNCTTNGSLSPQANGGPGIRCLGTTPGPTNPVPTGPNRAASFWVHDCYLESYDGLYQISPNVVQWGSNINFVDCRFENLTGISRAGPVVLMSAGTTTIPANFFIQGYVFSNISAIGVRDGLALHNINNPGNNWGGGLFQNLVIDASPFPLVIGTSAAANGEIILQLDSSRNTNSGDTITVSGVTGTNANGPWTVTVLAPIPNTLPVQGQIQLQGSQFDVPWISGGVVVNTSNHPWDRVTTIYPINVQAWRTPGQTIATITDMTFNNLHLVRPTINTLNVFGQGVDGPVTFNNCTFDVPSNPSSATGLNNRYSVMINQGAANIALQNCVIGTPQNGIDLGDSLLMTVVGTTPAANNEVILIVDSTAGVVNGDPILVSGVVGTTGANNNNPGPSPPATPATWTCVLLGNVPNTKPPQGQLQLTGSVFNAPYQSGGTATDQAIPQCSQITITGCTISSINSALGVGFGVNFKQVDHATVSNNTLVKGPTGTTQRAFVTTVGVGGGTPSPGTTNCTVTNNVINGMLVIDPTTVGGVSQTNPGTGLPYNNIFSGNV